MPSIVIVIMLTREEHEPNDVELQITASLPGQDPVSIPATAQFQDKLRTRVALTVQGMMFTEPGIVELTLRSGDEVTRQLEVYSKCNCATTGASNSSFPLVVTSASVAVIFHKRPLCDFTRSPLTGLRWRPDLRHIRTGSGEHGHRRRRYRSRELRLNRLAALRANSPPCTPDRGIRWPSQAMPFSEAT
jgi:hypothetical protein